MKATQVLTLGGALLLGTVDAQAQLTGFWQIASNGCYTSMDGETDCSPGTATVQVTQDGNGLSGSLMLEPDSIPDFCRVTCDPVTQSCALQASLSGTVSGNSVEFAISGTRSIQADCDICQLTESYADSFHGTGTLTGNAIRGTFMEQITDSCQGSDPCLQFADCVGSTGSGTFEVRITDMPGPKPDTCIGDCNRDGLVTIDELVTGVDIALGNRSIAGCTEFDANGDQLVAVDELVRAVAAALAGCVLPRVPGCELGDACAGAEDCPAVICEAGTLSAACVLSRCVIGSCACANDLASCCHL